MGGDGDHFRDDRAEGDMARADGQGQATGPAGGRGRAFAQLHPRCS